MGNDLIEEAARALCELDGAAQYEGISATEERADFYRRAARAAGAVFLERAAKVAEDAEIEADRKMMEADGENETRNFAAAAVASSYIALAIRALAGDGDR